MVVSFRFVDLKQKLTNKNYSYAFNAVIMVIK